jgi:hypothetical protein
VEKEGKLHPSWRRWTSPDSPHMTPPGASQIQEVAREGGGEGEEELEDPAKHWWLPQHWRFDGQQPAGYGGPLLVRHDDGDADQKLVARSGHLKLKVGMEMVETQAGA